ncbi:MAG: ArsC family reductase [Pseudopedobacter saltans]|uniref:ArsC family reductase n=1 Tax=Pseudopedobacter saltans TaxID=151895 RepID=A0A2W5F422_9SPHI|nr:MAG: ArsC family reductase [Pseudopedobacter saltans]
MYKLYGIKNCNTVKKAVDWLDEHKIPFEFHDYKKEGVTKTKLTSWTKQVSWEDLVNKKGTTWRSLSEEEKAKVKNATSAITLMQEKTSVIKRPLIESDDKVVTLGFDEAEFENKYQRS